MPKLVSNSTKAATKIDAESNNEKLKNKFSNITYKHGETGTILIPKGMTVEEALRHMERLVQEATAEVTVSEKVDGIPADVVNAFHIAIDEMLGDVTMDTSFWANNNYINVTVDSEGNKVRLYVGDMKVPGIDGTLRVVPTPEGYGLFIAGRIKQMHLPRFQELVARTREVFKTRSLYAGKAWRTRMETRDTPWGSIRALAEPLFEKLATQSSLILDDETMRQLEIGLWAPIRYTEAIKAAGESVKRTIILYGGYGTGKSLTAIETARICVENGWTFAYCLENTDLKEIYEITRFYEQPKGVVVFVEDIDQLAADEENFAVLNNLVDGVSSKGRDVILVMTTNHISKLPESFLRAGRTDTPIPYRYPDFKTTVRLLQSYLGDALVPGQDLSEAAAILENRPPAYIHEAAKKALMMSRVAEIAALPPNIDPAYYSSLRPRVTAQILTDAAVSMRNHLALADAASQKPKKYDGMQVLGTALGESIAPVVNNIATDMLARATNVYLALTRGGASQAPTCAQTSTTSERLEEIDEKIGEKISQKAVALELARS